MLRLAALYLFVGALMVISVRRWFAALCGLVFLSVVMQHPSMPREIAGIQGLNPWNAAFLVIIVSWLFTRHGDGPRVPTRLPVLIGFVLFAMMLVLTGLPAAMDFRGMHGVTGVSQSARDVFVETVVNPLKYLLLGVMFYDGAINRRRVRQALFAAVGSGLCYAALMYKSMKLGVFTMDYSAARRATDKLIGLYANDMAEVLAFTLWAAVVLVILMDRPALRLGWLMLAATAVPAFLSLKSRAGFLAFCVTALMLGAMKWRRILVAAPIAVALVLALAPDVTHRVMTGVASESAGENDWDAISSGRTTYLWPAAVEQIGHTPLLGQGRYAILRTGAFDTILDALGRVPTHPHNSYLEVLMDAGIVGLLICLAGMWGLFNASRRLLCCQNDRLVTVLGAVSLIAVVTELSAGLAGSSFYPTQSAVPYLCIWGASLRVATERGGKMIPARRGVRWRGAEPRGSAMPATVRVAASVSLAGTPGGGRTVS